MLTLNDPAALSLAGDLRFDVADAAPRRAAGVLRSLSRPLRQGLGLRSVAHELLADARGVWAWTPDDCYAPATRHASVRDWMRANAGSDIRVWVSGELTRSIDDAAPLEHRGDGPFLSHVRRSFVERHGDAAASWPLAAWKGAGALGVVALAGMNLEALQRHGAQHGVRIRAVAPWWHHALTQARDCVPALARLARANVCVVEGRAAAWISTARGGLEVVRHCALEDASVDALRATIARMSEGGDAPTVVLGQGLADGRDTRRVPALVLGRLDGDQPPQWLRPSMRAEVH